MNDIAGHEASHLFLVRLWADSNVDAGGKGPVWHGKVQHVVSGDATLFSDWHYLIASMLAMMPAGGRRSDREGGPRPTSGLEVEGHEVR